VGHCGVRRRRRLRENALVTHPVVDEAIKKAALAWISVADGPALALWCMPLDGALLVVSGPGEQAAPGLGDTDRAMVSLRGDHGGRIVTWPAVVERLDPASEEWAAAAPQLAGKRLNASGTAEALVARWAQTGCAVVRLTPADSPELTGKALPDTSLAEPPRDSPARVPTPRPFRLHKVRKR
jgi:hypothetical protein